MSVRQCRERLRSTSKLIALIFLGAGAAWPPLASAHHSFTYLITTEGERAIEVLEGSVRVMRILNPHGAMIVDATKESGASEGWLIELSTAVQLGREGWSDDMVSPGGKATVAIFPSRSTPHRARLRAILIHGEVEGETAQLFVAYGIRGDTPVMRRLRERLPVCGGVIDASYKGSECFLVDSEALRALEEEFPGQMGYVMP